MVIVPVCFAVLATASAADFSSECQRQWHQWRGPLANGTAPYGDAPIRWSETTNIKWKAAIPGEGSATPIVWGDQVFVVAAVRTNRTVDVLPKPEQEPPGGCKTERPRDFYRFEVLSLDRRTGRTLWQRTATEAVPHEGRHDTNTYASASPSTDGERLYVSFGSRGIYCYDLQGNLQWKRDLGQMVTRFGWGEGTSPTLYGDSLVVNWDHEGGSFLVVLDTKTGKSRWKVDRDEVSSWATPLVIPRGGGAQIVVNRSNAPFASHSEAPTGKLVLTDDQSWGDIRSHGNPVIDTPVLDRLASEGARFERFYVSPYCSPTRASLLTGRYALRTGMHGVTRGYENMRGEEVTLAEIFKAAGYTTGCFGKWHNGYHRPMDASGQGFDEFFGFCGAHLVLYFDPLLEHNGRHVRTKGYVTDVLTDAAIRFMRSHRDRPFFCYVPYNAPHTPPQVPDCYFQKYKARGLDDYLAAIYGMCENVDDNLGRLLAALEELKLADQTIVVFLSDNGPNGQRYNGDMRGAKASIHEGGMRVPLFIRWPGHIRPATTIRPIAAHIDLLPTLTELCGMNPPATLKIDGSSLVPLLEGRAAGWPDRTLFAHCSQPQVAPANGTVRTERWRAVFHQKQWELYNMHADPAKKKNAAKEHPQVIDQLSAAYGAWFADVTQAGFEPIPIPVGFSERPEVILHGHEVFLHPAQGKGIDYVTPQGWAQQWITHWTSTEAWPWWPIEVVRPGKYEVSVRYTCKPASVGTCLQVEIGPKILESKISQAFDPPEVPGPNRSPIGSAVEKEWQTLSLGELTLPAGRTQLALRARNKMGPSILDVKDVSLRKLPD